MPCLAVVPKQPEVVVDWSSCEDRLIECGLLDESFDYRGTRHFSLGERFFSMVSFLGCMPFLVLDPAEGMRGDELGFCHAALLGPSPTPRPLLDSFSRPIRCQQCGQDLSVNAAQASAVGIECPACNALKSWESIRLGDTGGFACSALLFHGVHRAEAVPSKELMDTLKSLSDGATWRHFYLDDVSAVESF